MCESCFYAETGQPLPCVLPWRLERPRTGQRRTHPQLLLPLPKLLKLHKGALTTHHLAC